jgi:transposase
MLTLPPSVRIYLATTPTDMRKSIDGLCAVVRNAWQLDAFSGYLFVFASRRGDRIKILYWDRGGFVVYYKRLECGRFKLPLFDASAKAAELEATELSMLLDGIDTRTVRRPRRWQPPTAPPARNAIDMSAEV